MVFQYLGLALFGIADLRKRALPRWNGLPVLIGGWLPLIVLVILVGERVNGRWALWPEEALSILWPLSLVLLSGLGYLLQSDSQPSVEAAAAV